MTYLGRDPGAPALLLPTHRAPSVHPGLLEQALRVRFAKASPPLAVLVELERVVPLGLALPLARAALLACCEEPA